MTDGGEPLMARRAAAIGLADGLERVGLSRTAARARNFQIIEGSTK
ncbi:MAG: hypothetical protein ACOY45_02725 [Pseudomonadota bacterium]